MVEVAARNKREEGPKKTKEDRAERNEKRRKKSNDPLEG
jgi:hypothetical protein